MVRVRQQILIGENGSMTVMTCFLLPIMFILAILVIDIGELLVTKVRMQSVTDMAAIGGASIQATGMNEIADLNNESLQEYRKMKRILKSGTWHSKSHGLRSVRFFKRVFKNIRNYEKEANRKFAVDARLAVLETMRKNGFANGVSVKVTSPDQLISWRETPRPVSFRYIRKSCGKCPRIPTLKWSDGRAGNSGIKGPHDGRTPASRKVRSIGRYRSHLNVDIAKVSPETKIKVEVTMYPKSFGLGRSLFGFMPEITVKASAKPTGGHIRERYPFYKPVLIE